MQELPHLAGSNSVTEYVRDITLGVVEVVPIEPTDYQGLATLRLTLSDASIAHGPTTLQ